MDTKRLAQLLGMMGSAHDGEVLNAAKLAAKMVREANTTWPDLLNGHSHTEAYQRGFADGLATGETPLTDAAVLRELLSGNYDLTDWEAAFCDSVRRRGVGRMSEKQRQVLQRMRRTYGLW